MKCLTLFSVTFLILASSCSTPKRCGFDEYHINRLTDSTYAQAIRNNEELLQNLLEKGYDKKEKLIYIPVVVHVVYQKKKDNISEAQILSQINVLNEDYRKFSGTPGENNTSLSADTKIEFRLAQINPNGNRTSGIIRVHSAKSTFSKLNNDVKYNSQGGSNSWNSADYLNIWICPEIKNTKGKKILGYASLPGDDKSVDGVVIGVDYFGDKVGTAKAPYNMGRSTTHEIGHWLNLYHTFKGGCPNTNCLNQGDFVCDTPPVEDPSYGCKIGRVSCKESTLIHNYMDYSDDDCMNLFTHGQDNRMQLTLDHIRNSIKISPALTDYFFYVFGKHKGNYEYVLDNSLIVGQHSSGGNKFEIPSGSKVLLSTRGKNKVIFRPGFSVKQGGVLEVSY